MKQTNQRKLRHERSSASAAFRDCLHISHTSYRSRTPRWDRDHRLPYTTSTWCIQDFASVPI